MSQEHAPAQGLTEQLRSVTRLLVLDEEDPGAPHSPLMDLYEVADGIVVEVDLPGVRVEDIGVAVAHNRLTIEVASRRNQDQERGCYLRMERNTARVHRIVPLPVVINPQGASGRYERGVLVIRLPRIPDRRQGTTKVPIT